jgi:hypothetical protein
MIRYLTVTCGFLIAMFEDRNISNVRKDPTFSWYLVRS